MVVDLMRYVFKIKSDTCLPKSLTGLDEMNAGS